MLGKYLLSEWGYVCRDRHSEHPLGREGQGQVIKEGVLPGAGQQPAVKAKTLAQGAKVIISLVPVTSLGCEAGLPSTLCVCPGLLPPGPRLPNPHQRGKGERWLV